MKAVPRPWTNNAPIDVMAQHVDLPELPSGWVWKSYYSDPCAETHGVSSYGWITAPGVQKSSWSLHYRQSGTDRIHMEGFSTPQEAIDALTTLIYLGV
jgi:hypothetical protein